MTSNFIKMVFKNLNFVVTIFLSIFTATNNFQSNDECFTDKGIKTAIIKAVNSSNGNTIVGTQEIEFNNEGHTILIKNNQNGGIEIRRIYKNNQIKLIVTTRKEIPDFYSEDELEHLIENANVINDTAFVLSCQNDGRPLKLQSSYKSSWIFEYFGCEKEIITVLGPKGDTIQQNQSIFKDGILVETVWSLFEPIRTNRTSKYFDYKFDKKGYWIKRSYKHQGKNVITETRKLSYY